MKYEASHIGKRGLTWLRKARNTEGQNDFRRCSELVLKGRKSIQTPIAESVQLGYTTKLILVPETCRRMPQFSFIASRQICLWEQEYR